jgi:hypothetical protein
MHKAGILTWPRESSDVKTGHFSDGPTYDHGSGHFYRLYVMHFWHLIC